MTEVFCRTEKKYFLTLEKYNLFLNEIKEHILPDKYGKFTVVSSYFDTADYSMIRTSMEKDRYKEKIRLRCYGIPNDDSTVFLEIKKKLKGVVYKRRVPMSYAMAKEYIKTGTAPLDSQIMREIDYSRKMHGNPAPACAIIYDREAYTVPDDPYMRITFDTNIKSNFDNPMPESFNGQSVLDKNTVLMEIKSCMGMPRWLLNALEKYKIYPGSFSKYGAAYTNHLMNKLKGEQHYA